MRTQQLLAFGGLMLMSNLAIASKLESDDVPSRCWSACGSVVGISESCDAQHDDDDAEIQCICNWSPASTQIPLCAACISVYDDDDDDNDHDDDDDDDDDNDALDIVRSCGLSTTTWNPAAATTLSTATTTGGAATVATTTGASATGTSGSTSGSTSSGTTSGTSDGSSGTSSQDTTSAAAATSATPTNAAAGLYAPGNVYLAAVLGMMPLAWL